MSILLLGNNELYSQGIPELNKAGSLYIENKFSEALEECKKVLSITSNDSLNHYLLSGTHFMIGTIYSSLENYDSAIYHFEYNINNYAPLLTEDQLEKSLFSLDVHYINKLLLITDTLESPGLSNDKKIETYLNSISIIGTAIELFTNFNDTERVMKLFDYSEFYFTNLPEYWDRFAEDVSATCIHFSDYEGLSKFECPETSHLDVSDVEEFTNNLLNILEEKQFFER